MELLRWPTDRMALDGRANRSLLARVWSWNRIYAGFYSVAKPTDLKGGATLQEELQSHVDGTRYRS